jgi:hypothetical protein
VSVPGITESNRRWWVLGTMAGSLSMIMIDLGVHAGPGAAAARSATTTGTADGYLVTAGVIIAIATAALHRRDPVPDTGPSAPGGNASPQLTVLDQARELTAV